MFEISKYKKNAKFSLKGNWASSIVVALVSMVLLSLICGSSGLSPFLTIALNGAVGIITLAEMYFFLKVSQRSYDKPCFDTFLEGAALWLKGFLGYFWYILWVALWSCLFVIPGIVKAISYSQMFFIIAENPGISVTKAMNISKILTRGHKSDLFMLGLSFFFWMILCAVPGVALYVVPYVNTTFAYAYRDLKEMAISEGRISQVDFQ